MARTTDKKGSRSNPVRTRGIERDYAARLRKVATHVGHIIAAFDLNDPASASKINAVMARYADTLTEWATLTAGRMLADVDNQDRRAWDQYSAEMSRALRDEIRTAPTGEALRGLLADQVELIRSIPLDAAKRVHELTLAGLENSTRAAEIAKEIARSGEVAAGRANLIARTEVARTASTLTEARARHVGSDGYIWRTSGDSDVRESHRKMSGKFVPWDQPPTLIEVSKTGKVHSMTGHAGCLPNCRCYCEPVLKD